MRELKPWVLDTNVLVSRLLAPRGVAAQAVDRVLEDGVLLFSEATLDELAAVLGRAKFDPYVLREERQQFVRLLGGVSRIIMITHQLQACRDPQDDKFLDVALCGGAIAILTGDLDLLALDPFHGVRIVTPAACLAWPVSL